jgi:hypothetical protein
MPYERKRAYWFRYSRKKTSTEKGDGASAIAFIPRNELNVREIFAERAARLGYRILESRIPFPDYILGVGSRRVLAEAEFKTSDFLRHKHDISRCDLIVVWEHDLPYMPVPVLELKSEETHRPKRGRPPRGLLAR